MSYFYTYTVPTLSPFTRFTRNPLLNYVHTVIKVCGLAIIVNNTAQLIGRLSNMLVAVRTKDYTQRVDKSVNLKLSVGSLFRNTHLPPSLYYVTCVSIKRSA